MTSSQNLFDSYRRTSFFADIPHRICIRVGEENTDLEALLKDKSVRSWAYLTAFNPGGSDPLPLEENERRQYELEQIVAKTYRLLYRGEGIGDGGDWPPEASVLVLGIGREEAVELAERFGQRAIVFGKVGEPAELVDCLRF